MKKHKWSLKSHYATNAKSASYDTNNILTMEIFDEEKNLKFRDRKLCNAKPRGIQLASIAILSQIFGPEKRWLDLVQETKDVVE